MAPAMSNDLNSPVSLLWAHQLRREHAMVVSQLQELKDLHPSTSDMKKMMAKTEKAEENTSKVRKELVELRTAHLKTVKAIDALRKGSQELVEAHAADVKIREEREKSLEVEMRELKKLLTLRGDEFANAADKLRNAHNDFERGKVVMEQQAMRREDELSEMRDLIQSLNIKTSGGGKVGQSSRATARPLSAPRKSLSNDVSEADSFDLDASMLTAAAVLSRPSPSPGLARIRQSAVSRECSQRPQAHRRQQRQQARLPTAEPTSTWPVTPSTPLVPRNDPSPEPREDQTMEAADIRLDQGNTKLSAYIQIADSQHAESRVSDEGEFIQAFMQGLSKKRDRQKCEKKIQQATTPQTWEDLKSCFPVASQSCRQGQGRRVDKKDKRPGHEASDLVRDTQRIRELSRAREPSVREYFDLCMEKEKNEENTKKKRCFVELDQNQATDKRIAKAAEAARFMIRRKKRRKGERTKLEAKRQERRPSIPILSSSEDELSRGGER